MTYKVNSDNRPAAIEAVGNGQYYYHYNIVEQQNEERAGYDFERVIINEKSAKAAIEAVIKKMYSPSQEIDLRNDYERYKLGIGTQDMSDKYIAYLNHITDIKRMVYSDFAE